MIERQKMALLSFRLIAETTERLKFAHNLLFGSKHHNLISATVQNLLQHSAKYSPTQLNRIYIHKPCILSTQCTHAFRAILTITALIALSGINRKIRLMIT
jgi:hypothetical protein